MKQNTSDPSPITDKEPVIGTGVNSSNTSINPRFMELSIKNPLLIAIVLIVIALGIYLILSSSAASLAATKVWSSASDWSTGTLSGTSITGNTVSLFPTVTTKTVTVPTPNYALNQPVQVSSISKGNNYNYTGKIWLYGKYVNDGNLTTRWSSQFSDPQWVYIDLGSTKTISEVKINWETAYASAYQIQVSNDATNWTTIYSTTKGTGGVNDLKGLSGSGRYVRMYGTHRATVWGYSIWEMAVYGPSTTTTTTTTTYPGSGTITLPFDAGSTVSWTSLTGQTSLPTSTGISYQARTSSDNSTWSAWTSVPSGGSLTGLSASRYIQIMATLTSTNSSNTPLLNQLVLGYNIPVANPTVSFSASPTQISAGQSASLNWSSTNATTCTASGSWSGTQSTSGSLTVSPTVTSTYYLNCSGNGVTVTATPVTITVATVSTSGGGTTTAASGCTYNGTVSPCVGSPTTSVAGWGTPSFDDEFNGTSLNTTTWNTENGWKKNGITVSASNETVSAGNLILTLSSTSSGAEISTNTYAVPVGGFAEARVYFPGNGQTIYNWPAWWTSGPNWPAAGENDIAEGLGVLTENYHSPTGAYNHGQPSCTPNCVWSNGFHTYGMYRGSNYVDVYWDGVLYYKYSTDDNGAPENLILTNGCYSNCTVGAQVKVDYVRAWNSNSSGWNGVQP
ncbi:MAG TPA: discoidin domain-containing protein [Candidatus Saccharimonadales bacterium]|nr:discoidin domain-containing protein [Candidatus Saccharimonadales bacterium]